MNFLRLIKAESYTRGMMLSVLFNIISKGILFLLTIIIARYFGSDIKTDIYFFVFVTMILFSSFINNIDTAVLIPESMRLREKEGDEKANAFLNYFLLIYLVIGILFTVGMYFFGTAIFGFISKFPEADIVTYHNYFWLGSFFFIFHVLTNYLNSILTSLKYFSLPMIISSVKSCIVICCIFLLKAEYDVLSVILGGLISYAVNLFIQIYVLNKIAGWKFRFIKPPIRKKIWSNVLYSELGQAANVASSMFPLYLLSGFGSGVISVMNYGKNIADIPNTLISSQFANVSGIKLNEQAAQKDFAGMNETFLSISKLMVFILVPIGCFMFVYADPIVELFYRSRNFKADAITETAMFLQLLGVTIFSIGINGMVTRVLIAVQAIKQAFFYQVALNVFLIGAIWLCTSYYGAYGFLYATIVMNLGNFMAMYFICKKLVPAINYAALFKYTARLILVNTIIAAALFITVNYLQPGGLLNIISGFLLYLITLLILNYKFGLNRDLNIIIIRKFIQVCRYVFRQKYLKIMKGPLKGYLWTTSASYDYITGEYENPDTMKKFLSWLKPNSIFYDIGSNIGFHALTANTVISTGKIYAFEPMPRVKEIFEKHIRINDKLISGNKIILSPMAISNEKKEVEFSDDMSHRDGNTYIKESYVYSGAVNKITVQCKSIDGLIEEGYERPDIIKIDVEGAEYDVLLGAKNTIMKYLPDILLATHDCHLSGVQEKCLNLLKELGYDLQHTGRYKKYMDGLDDYIAIHKSKLRN